MTAEPNPYEPPRTAPERVASAAPFIEPQPSWTRGIYCGMLAAVIAFSLPWIFGLSWLFVLWQFLEPTPVELGDWVAQTPAMCFVAGLGIAFLFGLAGVLNYAPANRIGIVRALMYVGIVTLAAAFGALFLLPYQHRSNNPWLSVYTPVAMIVPVLFTFCLTHRMMRKTSRNARETS